MNSTTVIIIVVVVFFILILGGVGLYFIFGQGTSCKTNADCKNGKVCSGSKCITPSKCTKDSDCGSGQLCDATGTCVSSYARKRYAASVVDGPDKIQSIILPQCNDAGCVGGQGNVDRTTYYRWNADECRRKCQNTSGCKAFETCPPGEDCAGCYLLKTTTSPDTWDVDGWYAGTV